jgi:hypothetical protein
VKVATEFAKETQRFCLNATIDLLTYNVFDPKSMPFVDKIFVCIILRINLVIKRTEVLYGIIWKSPKKQKTYPTQTDDLAGQRSQEFRQLVASD